MTFVKSCITCGCAKARRHQPYGTLQQLLIPERPWHSISMDFIEQLLHDTCHCRQTNQTGTIPPNNGQRNVRRGRTTIFQECLLPAWSPRAHHIRSGHRVHFPFLPTVWNEAYIMLVSCIDYALDMTCIQSVSQCFIVCGIL